MSPAEPVPAWLSAWRARQGDQAPSTPAPRPTPAPALRALPVSRGEAHGFSEPRQWAYDGGVRREPVMDTDHSPPRVVRRVGWHNCLRCRRSFFSQDVGQRLCAGCRGDDDRLA